MTFKELEIAPEFLERLDEMGLSTPTPIQERAIPVAMQGRDVLGIAQTGTGKTVAFGLPLVSALAEEKGRLVARQVRGLILAPTRELAGQIVETLKALRSPKARLRIELVVGGRSLNAQVERLKRGADVLVATPGRLIDLLERGAVDLTATRFLVLDEADQMLDIGFIHALRKIATVLPKERQTMMFSATMPKQMNELAASYLRGPQRIEVSPPGKAADKVTQSVHFAAKEQKSKLLVDLLDGHRQERALVFSRTKHGAERLRSQLERAGFAAGSIHGNKSQGQRDRALTAFRAGEVKVLVATDVAARGIDIPGVGFVYNYDLPNVPENYVHRIGRTARAGRDGQAVAFCASDEMSELKAIEKVLGKPITVASGTPWAGVKGAEKPKSRRPKRRSGGRGRKRMAA